MTPQTRTEMRWMRKMEAYHEGTDAEGICMCVAWAWNVA